MVNRYVVELELDDAQLEMWERAQALAGELRELFMMSATSLRAYPERRTAIDTLHAQLEQLAPTLGWILLDGRPIAEPAPSEQTRAEATPRELPAEPPRKRAPSPATPPKEPAPLPPIERVPARPVDIDAERAAFERALAQQKTTIVEERAVVVGRVAGLVQDRKVASTPPEPGAVEELRKRFTPEPAPAPAPEPAPVDPQAASRADQHRLLDLISAFGNPPQNLAANPGSEIGQIHSGLTRVSAKQWKALLGRSRLALAAYLVARLRAARQMISLMERGAGRHADRVRQALQQLRRVCGPDATRVPGLVNEAEPAQGSWHEVALSMRASLDAYAAGGDAAELWAAFNAIGKTEAPPQSPPHIGEQSPRGAALAAEPDGPRSPDDMIRRLHAQLHEGSLTDAQLGLALGQLLDAGVKPTETRLINLAERLDERYINGKEFKNLRAALRKRRKESVAVEDDGQSSFSPPENWPLWPHVRGKRMAIVGGDRRPERADAIAATFQLAEVDWIECREDSPRPIQSLVERMRNQSVDLVVILQRYVSHSHSDAIFAAEQGACRVIMAYSYGLQNVLQGLERFLGNAE